MWNRESVMRLWEQNEGRFAGDTSAPEIVRLSKKYIGKAVCDVGAGSGALLRLVPAAIGLDLVPRHARVVQGDIGNMPFRTAAFDTVFATEVLEHLLEDGFACALQELWRVLKTDSHLIVTAPYREDLVQGATVCPQCGARFHRRGHVRTFDEDTLTHVLRSSGFEVVEVRVLNIGFRAQHRLAGRFTSVLARMGFLRAANLYVVSRKLG